MKANKGWPSRIKKMERSLRHPDASHCSWNKPSWYAPELERLDNSRMNCLRQRKMTLHLERPSETVVETETKLSQWAGGSVWHVEEVEERNASTG